MMLKFTLIATAIIHFITGTLLKLNLDVSNKSSYLHFLKRIKIISINSECNVLEYAQNKIKSL